jgi:hypothetical protein
VPLGCRVHPRTKASLEAAARRNGRTVSAEMSAMLDYIVTRQSRTQLIMSLLADAIDGLARGEALLRSQKVSRTWLNDSALHAKARAAAMAVFDLLGPKDTDVASDIARAGKLALELAWDEMRRLNPHDAHKPHQKRLLAVRTGLGALPDTVMLWGHSGREARRQSTALTAAERRELFSLQGRRVTSSEAKRFDALLAKLGFPAPGGST